MAIFSHFYARSNFSKPFKTNYLARKLMDEKNKKKAELIKKLEFKNFQFERNPDQPTKLD